MHEPLHDIRVFEDYDIVNVNAAFKNALQNEKKTPVLSLHLIFAREAPSENTKNNYIYHCSYILQHDLHT